MNSNIIIQENLPRFNCSLNRLQFEMGRLQEMQNALRNIGNSITANSLKEIESNIQHELQIMKDEVTSFISELNQEMRQIKKMLLKIESAL